MNIRNIRLQNMIKLIEQCGKQSVFADRVGMQSNEVSQIKNPSTKRNIGDSLARRIESEFGLSEGWMDQYHDSVLQDQSKHSTVMESASFYGRMDAWDSNTPLNDNEVEVPFFMDVELSAGVGSDFGLELKGAKVRFSKSTLRSKNVQPENAVVVKISGNSMEPRFFDGDVVGVDMASKKIIDGKFYAINHDGMLRVKRLYRLPGGSLRVNSLNTDEHPDEIYNSDESTSISVIGKLFWHSSLSL